LRPLAASLRPLGQPIEIIMPPAAAEPAPKVSRTRSFVLRVGLACLAAYAAIALVTPAAQPPDVVPTLVSGRAGVKSTSDGKPQQWHDHKVTVVLDPSLDDVGSQAKDAVRSAIGTWLSSDEHLPKIDFDEGKKPARAEQDGVNRVLRAPITLPGHENDVAVTIGYVDEKTGRIVEADIVFNERYQFADGDAFEEGASCDGRYDLANVATHEAGHFFGLGEDMTDPHATMYFRSAPCETQKRALTAPDVEVISSLYQASAEGGDISGDESSEDGSGGTSGRASGCAGN
jgi:hypothetical protein